MKKIIALGLLSWTFPSLAQEAPKHECTRVDEMPTHWTMTKAAPSPDADGDLWVVLMNKGTGDWQIGFIQNHEMFCLTGKGKTNPES
jgi:hypothetical protein